MGLDATVRCNCFEKGLMRPCPVDITDIYVDDEGYLSSRRIDEAHEMMDYRRFAARYAKLQREVYDWTQDGCEHEDGEICSEWVSNWAGCAHFAALVEGVGGEAAFPLLSNLLPEGNGGIYPATKASETLLELDRFIEVVSDVDEWVLRDMQTDEDVWQSTANSSFAWMLGPSVEVGMTGSKVYFKEPDKPVIETSHFKQIPMGVPYNNGQQPMKIICLDTGQESRVFDSIGPEDSEKVEREFYVTSSKAPYLFEGKYPTAERIRNLLVASIQTGNPIRWC